jgi:MraZ protein
MFRGQFEHNIDAKGRVSVPVKFRDVIAGKYDGNIIVTKTEQSLVAYPMSEWSVLEEKLLNAPSFKPEVKRLKRFILSAAVECTIDRQGRILIPANLRKYANLDKGLVFVGMLNSFEIWNKDKWDKEEQAAHESFKTDSEILSEFGF